MAIDQLKLKSFKGFQDFTLSFRPGTNVIVGPNNAGKSTIITSLRLCAGLIANAKRKKADEPVFDEQRDRRVRGFYVDRSASTFIDENVRYEFGESEARIELRWRNKATLYVVWPPDDEAFYYLEHVEGMQPKSTNAVKENYTPIGTIPTLSPVDHMEAELTPKYVRNHIGGRLSSRHFRNQLSLLKAGERERFDEFIDFAVGYTPEIDALTLNETYANGQKNLDLYYRESSTRTEKELCWSGDGLQIWLQVLHHVWRQQDVSTLVLDEPDVFLHPDLQRRLVRLVENFSGQIIMATHAPEIVSESNRDTVIIVDRTRRHARRVRNDEVLSNLNDALGSGFNLKLARTLRSKVALFVEGDDMKVLSNIARKVGAESVHNENGLAIASMGGFTKREYAASFGWLNENLLDSAVRVFVILDRDYLPDEVVYDICKDYENSGVEAHIWGKKELESYLVIPSAIARLAGAPVEDVETYIDASCTDLKHKVFARYMSAREDWATDKREHQVSRYERNLEEFESMWVDADWQRSRVPAKELLSAVNEKLQRDSFKSVSVRALSSNIRAHEVPAEMRDVLLRIESYLQASSS